MAKLPKRVEDKIKAYREQIEENQLKLSAINGQIEETQQEIAKKEEELKTLMDSSGPEISDAEMTVRQGIAVLKMKLTALHERRGSLSLPRGMGLAIDAVKEAKKAAHEKYEKEGPKKLEAIEQAKIAYLQAVADYGQLKRDAQFIFTETARLTNPHVVDDVGGTPTFPETAWNYRSHLNSDGNKYTIFADELNHALHAGEVKDLADSKGVSVMAKIPSEILSNPNKLMMFWYLLSQFSKRPCQSSN